MSGGGDTDLSDVDTVVSGDVSGCMCDLDSVSRCDVVVHVGEMSLAGGGDTVVSGVDEPTFGDSSVMTVGGLDVCACDSLVFDETGEIVSVDDVVACGGGTLLHDSVRVGGHGCRWLVKP